MKLLKFFQYAYLIFAVIFLWDAIQNWSEDRNRTYTSLFLAALSVFMYFFRKRFRKKIEERNKNNKD
ncbi:hypothetical protein [Winogradskyella sp. SYSU M77433]|uniref:hypothetical protein n=1 Tax=Winogradskyella sp. SYSU M77433 TaxID=3042722 RepID=UPI002481646B|nr:hypothetical protein [Winogradskyella sp. SYSU M77433]MDH7911582.1 hypothetical protein [Winogradskyella sp. SYSU M77433]